MDKSKSIVTSSYYMINLFNKDIEFNNIEKANNEIITNLKLQYLMYLTEAYYINVYNKEMFNEEWRAWSFGVFNPELYNYFKKYGSMELFIDNKEKAEIDSLPQTYCETLTIIYNLFSDFNTFELLTLLSIPGSPLYNANAQNFYTIDSSVLLNKNNIKRWFKKTLGDYRER